MRPIKIQEFYDEDGNLIKFKVVVRRACLREPINRTFLIETPRTDAKIKAARQKAETCVEWVNSQIYQATKDPAYAISIAKAKELAELDKLTVQELFDIAQAEYEKRYKKTQKAGPQGLAGYLRKKEAILKELQTFAQLQSGKRSKARTEFVEDLTKGFLESFFDTLEAGFGERRALNPETIHRNFVVPIRAAFNAAIRAERWLGANPLFHWERPANSKLPRRRLVRQLEVEREDGTRVKAWETSLIKACSPNPELRYAIDLLSQVPLRREDLTKFIKGENTFLDEGYALFRVKGRNDLRKIFLNEAAVAALRAVFPIAEAAREKAKTECKLPGTRKKPIVENAFFFSTPDSLSTAFDYARAKAAKRFDKFIPEEDKHPSQKERERGDYSTIAGLRLHDLKHDTISRYARECNSNVALLVEFSGNTDIDLLLKTYVNPLEEEVRAVKMTPPPADLEL